MGTGRYEDGVMTAKVWAGVEGDENGWGSGYSVFKCQRKDTGPLSPTTSLLVESGYNISDGVADSDADRIEEEADQIPVE